MPNTEGNSMIDSIFINDPKQDALRKRVSSQPFLPRQVFKTGMEQDYTAFPYHSLSSNQIHRGYDSLAEWLMKYDMVLIDGFSGVFWGDIIEALNCRLQDQGFSVQWVRTHDYLKVKEEIDQAIAPYLGAADSVWGTKCKLNLEDFFDFKSIVPSKNYELTIIIGEGAALVNATAPLLYLDVPKNEIQYRMRAGAICNLGNDHPEKPVNMYKRFYFVDWVVLNEHKKNLLDRIAVFADTQWLNDLNWILFKDLKQGLQSVSRSVFRARPWFEAGSWGGQWMKQHLSGINREEVNYAWSFELITPENGLVFESDGKLLETAFDLLMMLEHEALVGKHAKRFQSEFPIRFDFLDTFNGGNLSIQCHPSLKYIREIFGESITQDETYYIMDCQENAQVYLGFQQGIDPGQFQNALQQSLEHKSEIDISKYVQTHPSNKHDLFLIPNQTIHSAGAGNLVLEISATPYIFTFKMYDWLRLDLNGEPRPINIHHAFHNLNFSRKGETVKNELIARPVCIEQGADWQLLHLPTHQEHFYDVHRIDFQSSVAIETENSCHVMMLVEGKSISVELAGGEIFYYQYAETFIIPAAVQKYKLVNHGQQQAKVIKAFLK